MFELTEREMVLRLVTALVLGGAIGFEREYRARSAGLRTYALAAEGAALFMMASILIANAVAETNGVANDPSRIASTVVQGIGFLAAGVIFAQGARVKGLTTAAGLWVTAAIGLLAGGGFYFLAISATVATAFVMVGLKVVERRFLKSEGTSRAGDEDEEKLT
jgi:putative Mg2+ transporter-C (MgtC) family protein